MTRRYAEAEENGREPVKPHIQHPPARIRQPPPTQGGGPTIRPDLTRGQGRLLSWPNIRGLCGSERLKPAQSPNIYARLQDRRSRRDRPAREPDRVLCRQGAAQGRDPPLDRLASLGKAEPHVPPPELPVRVEA